jgi:uncharacterized membrane protein required for colicin V production
MSFIDLTIIFVLAFSTAAGFFFGFIRVVGAVVKTIISLVAAGIFYQQSAQIVKPYLFDNANLSAIVAFTLIYWISSLFLSFVITVVNKVFDLPVLKSVNRVLGAVVALLGTTLVLSLFLHLFKVYAWIEPIQTFLEGSTAIAVLVEVGKYASWIIPGI